MARTVFLIYILMLWIDKLHSRGLRCYTCFNAVDLDTCKAVTECKQEKKFELCGARRYVDRQGVWRHDMGCIPIPLCPNSDISRISPVGRRRRSPKSDISKMSSVGQRRRRQVPGVFKCCDTDYCKVGQFNLEQTTREQSSQAIYQTKQELGTTEAIQKTTHEQGQTTETAHQTTSITCDRANDLEHCTIWGKTLNIDICKNDEVANHLCRHYCGRCSEETTTYSAVSKLCKDHEECPSLLTSFNICKDEETAIHICPLSCHRCNDVISGTTKMAAINSTSTNACHDNPLCEPLLLQFNVSELCSDDFVSVSICKQTCNSCNGNGTISSKLPAISRITTAYIPTKGFTTKNIYQFSTTATPKKQCIDLDPNCPYLESTINICNDTSVAIAIGCDLTCGFCQNTNPFLAQCKDLDGQSDYCTQEHREVICHDEEAILRSKCFQTCGRCDLFCTANPPLCKYPTTTPSTGDKACTDIDIDNYCEQINVEVDCFDEFHINSSGCFSTCHRCDLHPNANITLPHYSKSGTVTTFASTQTTGLQTTPSDGDKSCKDSGLYCTSPHIVCQSVQFIITYGCFSTCSRCDLSSTFSTIPSIPETTEDNFDQTTTDEMIDKTVEQTKEAAGQSTQPDTTPPQETYETSDAEILKEQTTKQMTNKPITDIPSTEHVSRDAIAQMITDEQSTELMTDLQSMEPITDKELTGAKTIEQTTEPMSLAQTTFPETDKQSTEPITDGKPTTVLIDEQSTELLNPGQSTIGMKGTQRMEQMTTDDELSTDVTKMQTNVDLTIEPTTEETTPDVLTTEPTRKQTTEASTDLMTTEQATEPDIEATTELMTTEQATEQDTEATTELMTTEQTTEITTEYRTTTVDPYAACKAPITKDNAEFYLLYDRGPLPFAGPELKLFVSSHAVKWVVLFNPELGICLNISVNATNKGIVVPSEFLVNGNVVEHKGIYTITSAKTSMSAFYKDPLGYEAFSVIPKTSLSTQYLVTSYPTNMGNTFIGITATKPNTTVNINLKISGGDSIIYNNMQYKNGQTITLHLNRSGTVEIAGTGDLTGSRVVSNNEIAVQSGSGCAKVPEGSSLCNYLIEMMPPFEELGTSFFVPQIYQNKTFIVRVISSQDNTNVKIEDVKYNKTYVLSKSGDFLTLNSSSPMIITSEKPVMVVYYQTGLSQPPVPFMTVVKPTDKFKTSHDFIIPDDGLKHHILITCKSREYPFLTLDNNPLIFKNPYVIDSAGLNNTIITARADIGPGHHTMGSLTGKVKFGVIVNANGDAANNVAYGFPT